MANNFQSIVGGIFRGLSNNRASGGLNQTNTQSSQNPLTYQWIGFPTPSDLRQPIQKEQTQNPSLAFEKGSAGTSQSYSMPPLTDIPTLVTQGMPGPDSSFRLTAGSVGSKSNIPALRAPINNAQGNGFGMSPQNGDHFKQYFANQIGLFNVLTKPVPEATASAISVQQHTNVAGNPDAWASSWQTFLSMAKGYNPAGNF